MFILPFSKARAHLHYQSLDKCILSLPLSIKLAAALLSHPNCYYYISLWWSNVCQHTWLVLEWFDGDRNVSLASSHYCHPTKSSMSFHLRLHISNAPIAWCYSWPLVASIRWGCPQYMECWCSIVWPCRILVLPLCVSMASTPLVALTYCCIYAFYYWFMC
jgi:hypothetical protein